MFGRFRNLSIKTKIMLILLFSLCTFELAVQTVLIPQLQNYLIKSRQTDMQHRVEVAFSILVRYDQKIRDDNEPPDISKAEAIKMIRALNFGAQEYFWIHDLSRPFPRMVMHSTIPSLDGNPLDAQEFNRATGKRKSSEAVFEKVENGNLFVAMNEVAEDPVGGFVSYSWPKPAEHGGVTSLLFPKVSFVKKYAPWGWVIGTGFYVDDIYSSVTRISRWIHIASIFFLLATLFINYLLIRFVYDPLSKLAYFANRIADGDYSLHPPTILTNDAVGILSKSLAQMSEQIRQKTMGLEKANMEMEEELEERKKIETALASSEEHFRTLLNSIPDLIWLKDADGLYISCNKVFERFFGASEADIIGKSDYDFICKEQADLFRFYDRQAMIAGGVPNSNEEWVTFADSGERLLLETTKTALYDYDSRLLGIIGIGHDITRRRAAEEEKLKLEGQLQQSQKMEAVGRLAGGVAHDFNNMLTVILGHAELAMIKVDSASPVFNSLEVIRSTAGRSADLTRQLLAFARKQTVVPKVLDLNASVKGILSMLQRLIGENISLKLHTAENLWPVKIDPSQIDQIFANLCVNARDAIGGVGTITIETSNCCNLTNYCEQHDRSHSGDYITITVRDSGSGMDKETISHIFEPFFTTKGVGEGTGLGLATVYGIVKQDNGFIGVQSKPGFGTTFSICLPRYLGDLMPSEGKAVAAPHLTGDDTILLVEDEIAILKMTTMMLENLGYTVLAASSPQQAFDLATEHIGRINLLITDVVMPEMNGMELSIKLQEIYQNLNCLFMSGYTTDVIANHGVLDEGMHFIQKPFLMADLAAKVREVLDSQP